MKRTVLWLCILLAWVTAPLQAHIKKPLKVLASFSILGDMVKSIGKEQVDVAVLVGPNSDAHTYEPAPQDAKALINADLILINGLGFEGWITRLIEASGPHAPIICVTDDLKPLIYASDGKTPDPHTWNSPRLGIVYIQAIQAALTRAAPEHKAVFAVNAKALTQQLQDLDRWFRKEIGKIAPEQRMIVTSHSAFAYLCRDYGLTGHSLFGTDTNSQPSAKQVAGLIDLIRAHQLKGLFVENITNVNLMEQVAEETHMPVLGVVYSDALSNEEGPAATYVKLLTHNLQLIVSSWKKS